LLSDSSGAAEAEALAGALALSDSLASVFVGDSLGVSDSVGSEVSVGVLDSFVGVSVGVCVGVAVVSSGVGVDDVDDWLRLLLGVGASEVGSLVGASDVGASSVWVGAGGSRVRLGVGSSTVRLGVGRAKEPPAVGRVISPLSPHPLRASTAMTPAAQGATFLTDIDPPRTSPPEKGRPGAGVWLLRESSHGSASTAGTGGARPALWRRQWGE